MREAAVPLAAVVALGGWEGGGTQGDYGTGLLTAPTLRSHIQNIRYTGLDLYHLTGR